MDLASLYKTLIPTLMYPSGAYHEQVERCQELVREIGEPISDCFRKFSEAIQDSQVPQLEERYIQTFDMAPAASLDIGWQLFGEDYNRGLFLVKMREYLRKYEIAETKELPDHMSHVLAVLSCMDEEEAADFATACVIPALDKAHQAIKEDNPYWWLIEGIKKLLEAQYGRPTEETNHG